MLASQGMVVEVESHCGVVRNLAKELTAEADSSSDDDDQSVEETHGFYEGDCARWKGCVCGAIHPRPQAVFWIQCDGPCQTWYNVFSRCVGFDEEHGGSLQSWLCQACEKKLSSTSRFALILDLPDDLMYRILEFCARRCDRAPFLNLRIAPLSWTTKHTTMNRRHGLWDLILQEEYGSSGCEASLHSPMKRSSKRQRRVSLNPRDQIVETHLAWCAQTDDAHMALATMAESRQCPLNLKRLRNILPVNMLRVNRRSQSGRTLLQACCACDYVSEGVLLRCVKELVEVHGADPNVSTNAEYPDADRPALFFAIARVMPSVVEYLVKRGASLAVKVSGQFRLVSDPSKRFYRDSCTPLNFAKALKHEEASVKTHLKQLPIYWATKLNTCIRNLSESHKIQ